jgi:hypothetical protein
MKCQECETAIYGYRELSDPEKQSVFAHIQTCASCKKIFSCMQQVNDLIWKIAPLVPEPASPISLTDKIMREIKSNEAKTTRNSVYEWLAFFDSTFARYSLAAVSACLVLFFFFEINSQVNDQSRVRGPLVSLQGAIINSQSLKKEFADRRERKRSIVGDCKNPASNNLDVACLKGKIKKLNF